MRTLIFGGTGMLGHKLVQVLGQRFEVWTTIRGSFSEVERFGIFDRERTCEGIDVTDDASVRTVIERVDPEVVINAVGVIKQVPDSKDVIRNLTLNSIFPQRLAGMSAESGFRLITISTDCVFDGNDGNYAETDPANARDVYGMSKLLGEITDANALTIRTSIIGRELATRHSIVEWFLSNRGESVNGYVNALYSGFPTIVLAEILADLISRHTSLKGLYHVSSDAISKHDLLSLLNKSYGAGVLIDPYTDYSIDRSLDSTRFRSATGFQPKSWQAMIDQMALDPTPYDRFHSENK